LFRITHLRSRSDRNEKHPKYLGSVALREGERERERERGRGRERGERENTVM
jgi:hypothetical protein